MRFELSLPGEKCLISRKKPTTENDDGLLPKVSRGNRSPVELFLASVANWDAKVIRLVQAA
jgi:hypothetical protein